VTLLPVDLVACPDCDLLQRIPVLPPGGSARCCRCGRVLATSKADSLERTLALAVAAAIVFIIANVTPMMGMQAVGHQASTTIVGGAHEMWVQGQQITALLVLFCTVVAPAVQIGFLLVVLIAVRRPPAPAWTGMLLRLVAFHQPWAMIEVMMLGILVSLIKIAELATVIPGIGMFAAGALVVLIPAMAVSFDPEEAWKRIEWAGGKAPSRAQAPGASFMTGVKP
jgi:paraquat-inducible protein A